MKSTVTLYEFMPYGAPDLIESRRRHMGRALALTSGAALVVSALLSGILALMPEVVVPVVTHELVFEPENFQPHRQVPLALPKAPLRPAPVVHEGAEPVAVPDDIAPPSDIPAPFPSKSDDAWTDVGDAPIAPPGEGAVDEPLPAFRTWVYVEQEPVPITEVKPDYPEIALQAGIEGRVTVHVLVGKNGRVLDAVLSEKIQVPMLNAAALAAARRWVFTPGLANGHPVACWTAIPFHFRLH